MNGVSGPRPSSIATAILFVMVRSDSDTVPVRCPRLDSVVFGF